MGSGISSRRLDSIDALRGIAVLLMIQQHVLYWLSSNTTSSKLVLCLGGLGGLAAPIFVTLAGVGTSLGAQRHLKMDLLMPARGVIVLAFGYLLNFLAPHWFSLGAWYVLHLIGFAIIISPYLRRFSTPYLLTMMAVVIIMTAIFQSYLGTPLRLYNQQMSDPVNVRGFFRHIFVEGFFPVFPWLAYFMAGMASGRWILNGQKIKIAYLGTALIGGFVILAICGFFGFKITTQPWLMRFFTVIPSFYPSLTPIILFLISIALFFLYGFLSLEKKRALHHIRFLVFLGQSSLTLLIVHVAVIRGAAHKFHFWRIFSVPNAVLLTWSTLLFFTAIAFFWHKINYRYGAEWILRKVSKKIALSS